MAEEIAIGMPARLWSIVDGAMDNAGSDAIDEGDEESYAVASSIRDAGAEQVPWAEDSEWPPMDQEITIRLTLDQWRFALRSLRESAPFYEEISEKAHPNHRQEYVDSLEFGNRAADLIAARIGETDAAP